MIWRKPALFVILFCLLQTCSGQIAKGTIMAGGSLGFSYATDHEDYAKTFTFNFTPLLGGFVAKNFVLGVAPIISITSTQQSIVVNNATLHIHSGSTALGLGPFARYYIKIGPIVYLFIHASPAIGADWVNPGSSTSTPVITRTIVANWTIGPGFSIMLTKSVAIELSAYYMGTWHRSGDFMNGNLVGQTGPAYVDNGFFFNAGFQVYFERNKKIMAAPSSK